MFGKTLLSIVALLFAGSQIVNAADFKNILDCKEGFALNKESECDDSASVGSTTNYCYKDKVIYGFTDDEKTNQSKCTVKKVLEDGVNILSIDVGTIGTNDLSNLDTTLGNTVIFDCESGKTNCQRITGLARKPTTDDYYFVGIGTVGEKESLGTTKNYLIFEADGAKYYKYDSGSGKYINDVTGFGDNLCVDAGSAIWSRKDALCEAEGADCIYYYDCVGGKCSYTRLNKREEIKNECNPKNTGIAACKKGYHITNEAGTALETNGGKLWYCGDSKCDAIEDGIGYFVNADDDEKPSIYCTVSSNVQSCSKTTISEDECSAIGQLRATGVEVKPYAICLSTTGTGISLADVNNKQLIIEIATNGNLYGVAPNEIASTGYESTKFNLVLSVTDNNVQLVKESTPVRYKYTNADRDEAPIIYDRAAAQIAKAEEGTNICFSDNEPFEYKLVQWVDSLNNNNFADFYISNEEEE